MAGEKSPATSLDKCPCPGRSYPFVKYFLLRRYYEGRWNSLEFWESGNSLIIHFVRHYEPMKKITGKVGGSMEIFLILIIICLLLGIVSPPSSSKKKSDKLPPDFFDNYYKKNKD